jgi:2-polyprenyl-3-methyl-5-hydroxy-6-metoxy-1,4-benzoquinol methylase
VSTPDPISRRWSDWRATIDLEEYHSRWARMEASGEASHGEADFIEGYRPASVLDAGCGMGRVAIELHHRSITVEGADLDADLLAYAQADAPHIPWHHADLAELQLGRTFDVVAMPGNVMIFCRVEDRGRIVTSVAGHLDPDGLLIAGFTIDRSPDRLTLAEYDAHCSAAGLVLVERYATWERAPYEDGNYAVSVHQRTA